MARYGDGDGTDIEATSEPHEVPRSTRPQLTRWRSRWAVGQGQACNDRIGPGVLGSESTGMNQHDRLLPIGLQDHPEMTPMAHRAYSELLLVILVP